ncbi:MAG: CoA-binding protein [Spirochaetales bacterium]|nr:CoA-binding protein [Spirochaetales bacterium]
MGESSTVVVLGASPKSGRYSNMAVRELKSSGYRVIPVNPGHSSVEEIKTVASLGDIDEPVHTLTMYLSPVWSERMEDDIISLNPERVIFNPGTESVRLREALSNSGISCLEACTLVMLSTKQFNTQF